MLGRETLFFPAEYEKEFKELSARLQNIPVSIIRKNPEICAA